MKLPLTRLRRSRENSHCITGTRSSEKKRGKGEPEKSQIVNSYKDRWKRDYSFFEREHDESLLLS